MQNRQHTISSLTDDADGVCASQSAVGAGALSLDGALVSGGVATFAEAQKVSIASAGDDSGLTFTIAGIDPDGVAITIDLAGGNIATATTSAYFKTVTGVSVDGATASTVTVGTLAANGAVSPSLFLSRDKAPFAVALSIIASGTLTCAAQFATQEHDFDYDHSFATDAYWFDVDGLTDVTDIPLVSNLAYPVVAVRLKISAYTSGTATLIASQAG